MLHQFNGIEFDWFAIDSEGSFALFATAGEGFIPEMVVTNSVQHDSISGEFSTPNWGTLEIWNDYAVLGIFVYDWVLPGGPYRKKSAPSSLISQELKAKIMAINCLPRFPGTFSGHLEVSTW